MRGGCESETMCLAQLTRKGSDIQCAGHHQARPTTAIGWRTGCRTDVAREALSRSEHPAQAVAWQQHARRSHAHSVPDTESIDAARRRLTGSKTGHGSHDFGTTSGIRSTE